MADIGAVSKIIPAQAVKLYRGSDELVITKSVRYSARRIKNTSMTRAGPIYTYQWRDIQIEATVSLTEDLREQLETDNTLSDSSVLTFNNWKIEGLSITGTQADNAEQTLSCGLLEYSYEGLESGEATATIKLQVAGATS